MPDQRHTEDGELWLGLDPGARDDRRRCVRDLALPKDGTHLLPLKDAVRQPLGITAGDEVVVDMTVLGTSPRMR